MSKKILKGALKIGGAAIGGIPGAIAGGVLSSVIGKKKKKADPAQAAPAAPTKGPKVTPLGAAGLPLSKKRGLPTGGTMLGLSDRLGG